MGKIFLARGINQEKHKCSLLRYRMSLGVNSNFNPGYLSGIMLSDFDLTHRELFL